MIKYAGNIIYSGAACQAVAVEKTPLMTEPYLPAEVGNRGLFPDEKMMEWIRFAEIA